MAERWTKEEVFSKVDWEGGVADAIMSYRLNAGILPADTPEEVVMAWNRLAGQAKRDVDTINDWLDS